MNRTAIDLWVGIFVVIGLAAIVFLALKVGNLTSLNTVPSYRLEARFDNIGGLKLRAPVKAAGVVVGRVDGIRLDAKTYEAVVALNTALVTDGALLDIKEGATLAKPVLILNVTAGPKAKLTSLRHTVTAGRNATATIIEAHVAIAGAAAGQSNTAVELTVDQGAAVTHLLASLEGGAATHVETITTTLGQAATLKSFQFHTGIGLGRTQTFVTFAGTDAKLDISGLMLGRARQHCDTTLVIDHAVPGCESRELFKAVLDDTARAVFQGKVIVRPHAQKTDGKQMAKALMLSEGCEFDSKPELEIYADDVVCGHGATVAEIDPGMMFYLRSRGIPQDEARAMLIESFVGEALEKIDDEGLRDALSQLARGWLQSLSARTP